MTRASTAFGEKVVSGEILLGLVEDNWTRTVERPDSNGTALTGVLLEPAGTNLFTHSQLLDNAGWSKSACAITANSVEAPDGTTTGDSFVPDATAALHGISQFETLTNAAVYTASCWFKAGTSDWVCIRNHTDTYYAFFDVANGTVGTVGGGDATARISGPYNGDWYRCEMTWTSPSTASKQIMLLCAEADNDAWLTGDASAVWCYGWGGQLEAGAYASSYIVTPAAASVTRAADSELIHDLGSALAQSEGSIKFRVLIPEHTPGSSTALLWLTGASEHLKISVTTDGYVYVETAHDVGNAGMVTVEVDIATGELWDVYVSFKDNRLTAKVVNVNTSAETAGTADTDCSIADDLSSLRVRVSGFVVGPPYVYDDTAWGVSTEPVTTAAIERAREHNSAFWFVHISGFPHLWFTDVPASWEVPSGWSYNSGLMLLPAPEGEGVELRQAIDPLGGIADADSINLEIAGAEIAALLRKRRRHVDSAGLATNDVDAGDDPATLSIDHSCTSWDASDGTVYLGNQTITYASYSGTTITTPVRGRYAILDDDLEEVAWKPRIEWSESLAAPPMVTLYPQRMIGRTLTLYRGYIDPISGDALPKNEAEIRFRGTISTYGDAGDGIGVTIGARSILDLLEAEAFTGAAEYELSGYGMRQGSTYTNHEIVLVEQTWWPDDGVSSPEIDNAYDARSIAGWRLPITVNLHNVHSADDLIKVLQDKFNDAYDADPGPSPRCHWFCRRAGGKVEIGASCRGIRSGAPAFIDPGDAQTSGDIVGLRVPVALEDPEGIVLSLLGFGERPTPRWATTASGNGDWQLGKHSFAGWTNPSDPTWSGYLLTGLPYDLPVIFTAEKPPARAAWHNTQSYEVPIDLNGYGDLVAPGDGGPTLVHIDDEVVYQATEIDESRGAILLSSPQYDIDHPIGSRTSPDARTVIVPEGADEGKWARQAWLPSLMQWVPMTIDGSTYNEQREGVQYFLLQTMLSTGSGDTYNGVYDVLHGGWGLEIPEAYVDTDSFAKIGDYHTHVALQRMYLWSAPFDFHSVLETEAKTLGFRVVVQNGKITAVADSTPTYARVAYDIDNSTRTEGSGFAWQASPEGLVNQLTFHGDFDSIEEDYYYHDAHYNLASAVDAQRLEAEEIENRGMRSEYWKGLPGATTEVKQAMQDRLWRLSQESYVYECDVTRALDTANVGDVVTVTDARVINPSTGVRGIDRHLGTIEEIEFDDFTGEGRVLVRVRYDWDETYTPSVALSYPPINTNNFAPAVKLGAYSPGASNIPYVTEYTDEEPSWEIGAMVQLIDVENGTKHTSTVKSVDTAGQTIELDDADAVGVIDTEGYLTFQPHDDLISSADQDELVDAAFLADTDGLLSTQSGYRVVL